MSTIPSKQQKAERIFDYINNRWWLRLLTMIVFVVIVGYGMNILSRFVPDYAAIAIALGLGLLVGLFPLGPPRRESIFAWLTYALLLASLLCLIYANAGYEGKYAGTSHWFWIGLGIVAFLIVLLNALVFLKQRKHQIN